MTDRPIAEAKYQPGSGYQRGFLLVSLYLFFAVSGVYITSSFPVIIILSAAIFTLCRSYEWALVACMTLVFLGDIHPGYSKIEYNIFWYQFNFFILGIIIFLQLYAGAIKLSLRGLKYFIAYILFLSLTTPFSELPVMSLFKVMSFGLAGLVILILFNLSGDRLRHYFPVFFILLAIASIVTYLLGYGFERDARLFQGVFEHPQVLAIYFAPIAAYFLGRLLFFPRLTSAYADGFMLVVILIPGVLAGSRIFAFAIIGAFFFTLLASRNSIQNKRAFILGFFLVMFFLVFHENARQFIIKHDSSGSFDLASLYQSSRGFLFEESINNIYNQDPFFGAGFGVNKSMIRPSEVKYANVFGVELPFSFSTEKSDIVTALLEEIGIVGFLVTLSFVMWGYYSRVKYISPAGLMIIYSVIFLNMAEVVLFSVASQMVIVFSFITYSLRFTAPNLKKP